MTSLPGSVISIIDHSTAEADPWSFQQANPRKRGELDRPFHARNANSEQRPVDHDRLADEQIRGYAWMVPRPTVAGNGAVVAEHEILARTESVRFIHSGAPRAADPIGVVHIPQQSKVHRRLSKLGQRQQRNDGFRI